MKEQFFAASSDLKEQLEKTKSRLRDKWAKNGTAQALQALSRALRDLQEAGLNIELQFSSITHEDIWKIARKARNNENVSAFISFTGVLKVDGEEYLFGYSPREGYDKIPVSYLYISERSFAAKNLAHDHRGTCFDLKDDPQAIFKFQKFIINNNADLQVIAENDTCGSFAKRPMPTIKKLHKPVA